MSFCAARPQLALRVAVEKLERVVCREALTAGAFFEPLLRHSRQPRRLVDWERLREELRSEGRIRQPEWLVQQLRRDFGEVERLDRVAP